MRKLMLVIPIFLLLTACGSNGPVLVSKYTVSKDKLMSICDNPAYCKGHSYWGATPEGQRWCDIYLMPEHEYFSENTYHVSWGHESRHCEEGNFHN